MLLSAAKVHNALVEGQKEDYGDLLGGTVPKKLIERMHPFARQGGQGSDTGQKALTKAQRARVKQAIGGKRGTVRLLPINRHTGVLAESVKLDKVGKGTYYLYADAPYAKHILSLTGTKKMVARGMLGEMGALRKRYKARFAGIVDSQRAAQRKHY